MVVGSLYRPPNKSCVEFVRDYEMLINHLKHIDMHLILGMDHNTDLLKASTHNNTQKFLELNLENELYPCITKSTRVTTTSATLIDNILIDSNLIGSHSSRIKLDDISDHLPTLVVLDGLVPITKEAIKITCKDMRECTFKKITSEPLGIMWEEVITENVDVSFNMFHDTICTTIDKHSPIKTKIVNAKKFDREPWITKGLLNYIHKQKQLYQDCIRSSMNALLYTKYKEYCNLLVKIKHTARKDYYATKCFEFKRNTKKLWQLINKISGKINNKTELLECLHINNIDCFEANSIVNEFGKYFSSVGKKFAESLPASMKPTKKFINKMVLSEKSMFLYEVTETEVSKLIKKLENKSSSGFDNISNVILKKIKGAILNPFTKIMNLSFQTGTFPTKMKDADVVPLFKNKSKNYNVKVYIFTDCWLTQRTLRCLDIAMLHDIIFTL